VAPRSHSPRADTPGSASAHRPARRESRTAKGVARQREARAGCQRWAGRIAWVAARGLDRRYGVCAVR
jgi:hypothetical protein